MNARNMDTRLAKLEAAAPAGRTHVILGGPHEIEAGVEAEIKRRKAAGILLEGDQVMVVNTLPTQACPMSALPPAERPEGA